MPKNKCCYVYKAGAKKGQPCGRNCSGVMCFQHANQTKNKLVNNINDDQQEEIIDNNDFIQLTNSPAKK